MFHDKRVNVDDFLFRLKTKESKIDIRHPGAVKSANSKRGCQNVPVKHTILNN